ncbi:hypothetical protein ACFV7Q_22200 [Streptomyces sp. NPDC059851]|uniref:hypothetical protein n=1 Tax=Streptomyces sp. NPDC059851 TaxID=3346971 RepID=UPI00364CC1CF
MAAPPTCEDRKATMGKAPARASRRSLPPPVLVLGVPAVAAPGRAAPVLGVLLLAFLVVDVAVGLVRRRLADSPDRREGHTPK